MAARIPIKTELQLSKLKAGPKPYDVPVSIAPGMVVRVSPAGRKTYRWDRGYGHKPRIVGYGNFPSTRLALILLRRQGHYREEQVLMKSFLMPSSVNMNQAVVLT